MASLLVICLQSKPKKGVSADEKLKRMLAIFHESADVFTHADVEKLSVKRGIISQAVKDVLQSLVDDDQVHKASSVPGAMLVGSGALLQAAGSIGTPTMCALQEKIGASNFYWSFPAEASTKVRGTARKAYAYHLQRSVLREHPRPSSPPSSPVHAYGFVPACVRRSATVCAAYASACHPCSLRTSTASWPRRSKQWRSARQTWRQRCRRSALRSQIP